jgi:CBS domain containing-hemolysin-like protein
LLKNLLASLNASILSRELEIKVDHEFEAMTFAVRLGATLFFVLLNGFFVAAEFAFVKVRESRIEAIANTGNARAKMAEKILDRLDLYLSSCQFGITVSSLILGWLAEPAIAELLIFGAAALGLPVANSALLHGVALAIALTIVTTLHMTLGEQAPKIWAIQRSEATALGVAYPLRIFTVVFGPLVRVINLISNWMLRMVGISLADEHETTFSADELRAILASSAQAGQISARQRQFANNILGFINLQVRHVLVPRVDIVWLANREPDDENLRIIRESGHTRFPLCGDDLDDVIGIIHVKDVMAALSSGQEVDLGAMSRKPLYIPDTQSLGRMIVEMQAAKAKSAIVLDDHGTAIGMAFLEDALEEIVGPIQDEFDDEEAAIIGDETDLLEMRGDLPLPEATELLGLVATGTDDTIGGHVVSVLGRLPESGDQLTIGGYRVTVTEVSRRRVLRLRFEPINDEKTQDAP